MKKPTDEELNQLCHEVWLSSLCDEEHSDARSKIDH